VITNVYVKVKRENVENNIIWLCICVIAQVYLLVGLVVFDDLDKLENVQNNNVCVISDEVGNKFVRKARHGDRENIYLYLHEGHYDAIVLMTFFFNTSFFCHDCLQPYTIKEKNWNGYVIHALIGWLEIICVTSGQ